MQQMGMNTAMGMPPNMRPMMPFDPAKGPPGMAGGEPGAGPQQQQQQQQQQQLMMQQQQFMMQQQQQFMMMMHAQQQQQEEAPKAQEQRQDAAAQEQGQEQPEVKPQAQEQAEAHEQTQVHEQAQQWSVAPSPTADKFLAGAFFESDIMGSAQGMPPNANGQPEFNQLPEMLRKLADSPSQSELSSYSTNACRFVTKAHLGARVYLRGGG